MGARHAQVVGADPACALLTYDLVPQRAEEVAARNGGRAVQQLPSDVDVVIVSTPTPTHREVAGPHLARGRWCLVEKPLAASLAGAEELARHPRCAAALSERHNRAVRAVGPLRARAVEARRLARASGRGLDGDVVGDLMIHDLDLVLRWAGGQAVRELEASGSGADGRIDAAHARVTFADGAVATVLASRVAARPARWVRVRDDDGVAALDLLAGRAWRGGTELATAATDALTAQWGELKAAIHADGPVDAGLAALALACRIRDRIATR